MDENTTRDTSSGQRATVARIWRGWAMVDDADAYQAVVDGEVMPAIMGRQIPGLLGAHILRSDEAIDGEVEFTTIIWFDTLESVKGFMGEDYRKAHVPENAQAVLSRFDAEATHFHVVGEFI